MAAGMQISEKNGTVEAAYIDAEGKLVKTTLQPFRVRGDVGTALTVDDPFYRIACEEYRETVRLFNSMPLSVRQQYMALVTEQMQGDNGKAPANKATKLSPETKEEYRANVLKHGLSPENPYATIVRDHESGERHGSHRVFSVNNRPVDERCVGSPVVISFHMQAEAYQGGNIFATARWLANMPRSYASPVSHTNLTLS